MPNYVPFMRPGVLTKNPTTKYAGFGVVAGAFLLGMWIDSLYAAQSNSFHNRSMQYGGRDLKEGETIWK